LAGTSDRYRQFSPLFIVGAPRSGTTLLAVLLNRHSRFSIPPETQFFTTFAAGEAALELRQADRRTKVEMVLNHERMADLHLGREELLTIFQRYDDSVAGLFRAILEAYAAKEKKARVGEKSPKHLEHVPRLLSLYPAARVICLVRDGRDVVRSLLKTPWAEPDNPRRFGLFCSEWSDYARLVERFRKSFPADRFMMIRYEDILLGPEKALTEICRFLGERFEPDMLDSSGKGSGVVPAWEAGWKAKADKALDPARAYAWKLQADRREVWRMNVMMGRELVALGYGETELAGCSLGLRMLYLLQKIPYLPAMRPVSLFGLRLLRLVTGR